jgi:electron transfer flavoprotein alpha subunit
MKQPSSVCVFSERQDIALELLSAGRALAGEDAVVSIVVGHDGDENARNQLAHGANTAYVVHPSEGVDPVEVQIGALRQTLARLGSDIVLIGATAHGTEIASRLAQRLGVGCASECTRLDRRDGRLVVEKTCLGRFIARQVIESRPAIASVQPRRFEPLPRNDNGGEIERLEVEAPATRTPIVDTRQRVTSNIRIDKADVVVGVGRGLRSRDDLRMIEELARVLGGVVGASRPLTDDLQWLQPDCKVGLSGVTVKPKLYIACGISGQIEHNVGMRESGVVVAINNDPAAPIMQQADYCITGDLHEVVPALIETVRKMRSRMRLPR